MPAPFVMFAALTACAPQDAEVEGKFYTWLAANSSPTVSQETIGLDGATRIDCARGWNETLEDWDPGYIGPRQGDDASSERFVGGDCAPEDGDCPQDALDERCADIDALEVHDFLAQDGYYAFGGDIEPTRAEVLINGEDHFQITVHHDLGAKEDFRFHFSIDPDFAPVECAADEGGNASIEYIDGANWLDEWSADEEDGSKIYYLNAGAIQINPNESSDQWQFDLRWLGGYGHARFADDLMSNTTVQYGIYQEDFVSGDSTGTPFLIGTVLPGSPGHGDFDYDDPDDIASYEAEADELRRRAFEGDDETLSWEEELRQIGGAEEFAHRIEDNIWRPVDATPVGVDGWMGLHSSWVKIDEGSKIEEDGEVSGSYQILYQGVQSNSRVLVTGTFKTNRIRRDRWAYPDLDEQKREENGTPFCGGLEFPG